MEFAYPRESLFDLGLLLFSLLFTGMWVWRKPFVVKPAKNLVRWLDKKAEED